MSDASYLALAACQGCDPDLFFPPEGRGRNLATQRDKASEALAVCARCPVRTECLADCLTHEGYAARTRHGIFGGTLPAERDQIAREQRTSAPLRRNTAAHGTRSGYLAHRNRGENACDMCKAAIREWARRRRAG